MTNDSRKPPIPGRFYWVLLVLDPDTDEAWENEPMVARCAGPDLWNFPGQEGASDWPVRWIGPEVLMPAAGGA